MVKRTLLKSRKIERSFLRVSLKALQGEKGVSAISFAIVGPLFIFLVIASLELAFVLMAQNTLEGAAREAARFGIIGGNVDRMAEITKRVKDTVQTLSGGMMDPAKVTITTKAYTSLENLGRPEPFTDLNENGEYDTNEPFDDINGNGEWDEDQGASNSFGVGGQAVQLELEYTWDTLIPFLGENRLVKVRASTLVVNEDFPSS